MKQHLGRASPQIPTGEAPHSSACASTQGHRSWHHMLSPGQWQVGTSSSAWCHLPGHHAAKQVKTNTQSRDET